MARHASIDPATRVGVVSLTVGDLARSLLFYRSVLGLRDQPAADGSVALVAEDGFPLLQLVELAGARPKPQRATGLYHFAVLLPGRQDLARWLRHVTAVDWPLQGWADHGVSEAIYLADPDGNGIEIYRDRPHDEWPVRNGQLQMVSDPLDARGLLALVDGEDSLWQSMPARTTMGHIHLHVADVDAAQAFYCDVLGFDLIQRYGPSALFVSAGGYHHHIGLNTWAGQGAPPAPPASAGLRHFQIVLPDAAALDAVARRLQAAGIAYENANGAVLVSDPSSNRLMMTVSST